MDKQIFTEYDIEKATKLTLREKLILPFLKTYVIDEEDCQLSYKMLNGKIYFVKTNLLPDKEGE